ncbi:MAG TPA: hypothetical protein VI543_04860, partial [Sulfuricaulis sp.]|nr:hypothetical protein [Sulfuricaulis sp.]
MELANAKPTGEALLPRPVKRLVGQAGVPPRAVFERQFCTELQLRAHLPLEQYRTRDAGGGAP